MHLLNTKGEQIFFLPGLTTTVTKGWHYDTKKKIKFKQQPEGVFIYTGALPEDSYDTVIELVTK